MALPNTYKRVKSLISNGGQYINTGLLCTSDITFEFVARFTEIDPNYTQKMIGATKDARNNSIGCLNGNYSLYWGRNGGTNNAGPADTEFHTFAYNNGNIYIDEEVRTTVSGAMSDTRNIWLFADSYDNRYAYMELQYCNFYSNGALVREYIPVKRTSDGVLGLYDLANDVFYTNSGSGSFDCSYEVSAEVNPIDSGTITGTGTYPSGSNVSLLATANGGYAFDYWELDGYTRLEYIESTGSQYIDTGLTPSYNLKALVKGRFTNNTGSQYAIGCYQATNINRFDVGLYNGSLQLNIGSYKDISNVDVLQTHTYILDAPNNCTYIDDTQYTGYTTQTGSNARNVLLFARWQSSITYYANFQAEVYQFWENGALIRDFIPVIRHNDGAIGLLDLVEMKFYGNSGTGIFIGGGVYAS